MLTAQQLQKFKQLYKDRFDIDLSEAEAQEKALQLVGLMKLIYKPMTKSEFKKFNN